MGFVRVKGNTLLRKHVHLVGLSLSHMCVSRCTAQRTYGYIVDNSTKYFVGLQQCKVGPLLNFCDSTGHWGTRWRSWLRHCATSRKVAGSISDGVIGIFHWHNHSSRTMTLGVKASGAYGWQTYLFHVLIVLTSGSLNLLEPSGPVQACTGVALPLPLHWTHIVDSYVQRTIIHRERIVAFVWHHVKRKPHIFCNTRVTFLVYCQVPLLKFIRHLSQTNLIVILNTWRTVYQNTKVILRLRDTSSRNPPPPPVPRSECGSSLPPDFFVIRQASLMGSS
jgi:hypothetical protein